MANFFEERGRLFWGITGLVFIVLLGFIDFWTGLELNISFFYLFPIALLAWFAGGQLGLFAAAACSIAGFLADYANGLVYSHPAIYVWNTLLRLGFFVAISWLVAALRKIYLSNQELIRVDFVTGAASNRYFYELARNEIRRTERYQHSFTFVFIDLDNFKMINDRLGHSTGDRVLRAVTECIQHQVRACDALGRLSGDEFGLLLPETDEDQAREVIRRIHSALVREMLANSWIVTFSVGVVTFYQAPKSVDEMVGLADGAMYTVKGSGKNGVNYRVYGR